MAVFTELSTEDAVRLLTEFDLGTFVELKPISSGIENTNYFLDTTKGRWVLTVFERLKPEELPFYLELCEHLAKKGCRVATPCRSNKGELFSYTHGKPFCIANRLTGESVADVTVGECRSMGETLAKMHLAAKDFPLFQKNLRGADWWHDTLPMIRPHVPEAIYVAVEHEYEHQCVVMSKPEFASLTVTACHCDLFRNNAMVSGHGTDDAAVSGVFDFYFAGCSPWLFDLAVTMNDWCIDPASGKFDMERAQAFIESYNAVRPLTTEEKTLWRDALRAAALRFWLSRLYDYYLPREASLLTPHDPAHFERVLADRMTCELPWPAA